MIYFWFLCGNSEKLNAAEKVNISFEHLMFYLFILMLKK